MKVAVFCSDSSRPNIQRLLESRRIQLVQNAAVNLVERGQTLPREGISIVYGPENIEELIDLFDDIGATPPDIRESVVLAKNADKFELVRYDDVAYFQSAGNYTYCRTKTKRYEVKRKLCDLEVALHEKGFIRINKSFLVNLLMIGEIIPWFGGRLLLKIKDVDTEIEVSRVYVKPFKRLLGM